ISVPMALAIIARETKRSRLLSLGNPIANRPDPVRVAEEMAWLDVLSGGRLEMGLVKGAPYEIAPANSNPANLMRRYWEAHDLILKAMSTTAADQGRGGSGAITTQYRELREEEDLVYVALSPYA